MFARYSVKKPYTVIVGVILVIVLGVVSFMNMTTDLLPAMELPYVVVYTTYVGATPEQVETDVTRPMEAALATVGNVKGITSTSSANVSAVIMEFNSGTNMDTALIEITSQLDQLSGGWSDSIGSPIVMKINPDMLPVSVVSVMKEDMDIIELSDYVESEIIPEYEGISGVASVSASGMIDQEISITIDQSRIDLLNSAILREIDEELAEVEQQLNDAQAQLSDGKRELARQKNIALGKINDGLAQIEDGEAQLADAIEQMKTERDKLQEQLDQVNSALEQMGPMMDMSDEEVELIVGMLEQFESLKAQRANLQERLDKMDETGSTVKAELEAERADAIAQRESLMAEKKGYEAYIAEMEAQDPEKLAGDIAALEQEIAALETERADAQQKLTAQQAEQAELNAQAEALRAKIAELGGAATAAPTAATPTDAPATQAPAETVVATDVPAATATAVPNGVQDILNWLFGGAEAESLSVEELQVQLADVETQLAAKDAEIAETRAQISAQDSALAEKNAELTRKQKALEDLQSGSAEDTQARIEEAERQIISLNGRIEALDREIALLDEAIAQTGNVEDSALREQLENALAQVDKAIAEIEASDLYKGMQMLENKDQLTQQYLQLEQAKAQLEAGIAQMDDMIAKLESGVIPGGLIEGIDEDTNLADAKKQLQSARSTALSAMADAEKQLADGEEELAKARAEFEEGREEAFKNAKLDGVITMEMVSGILGAQNFSMPAGYVNENGVDHLVRVGDKIASIDELKNLKLFELGLEAVDEVRLIDVARVEITDNRDEVFAKMNGSDGIMLSFQKQSIYSTAEVADLITAKSEELMGEESGLHVVELFNQGMYIDLVVDSVLENLLYGAVLAILVLMLFLLDYRPTIIIAFSIPISVVAAFVAMYFTGVTLNVISLAGLALGVGMLVDNSIVVIDNIYRLRQEEGYPILRACIEGTKQVSGAIAASTLTTICVFLPVVFVEGMSRDLFTDMGLTIAYSLLASLLVAMTLVPSMSASVLKKTRNHQPKFFVALQNGYAKLLRGVLKVKPLVLLVAIALLAFCVQQVMDMGLIFMPEVASTQMTAAMPLDEEWTFKESTDTAVDVMNEIMEVDGIDSVGVFSGGTGISLGGGSSSMTFYITVEENSGRTNRQIADDILARAEDLGVELSVSTSTMDISMLAGSGISVEITGPELPVLREVATDVAEIMQSVPGTIEVSDGMEDSTPELTITVDKEKAIDNGLTVAQVFQYVAGRLYGAAEVTEMTVDGKTLAVTVVEGKDLEIRPDDIADMEIEATQGEETKFVRIGDIADISYTESMASINRKAQQRLVTVSCGIDAEHNVGLVSRDIEAKLADYEAPEGYDVSITGESETINSTIEDLILMILLAVVFIFLIMVAQFQSFKSPIIVLFTIPLAFTGGLLALILTGMELSIVSMLGFLMLAGVVVNNGIVFVDGVNQLRIAGMGKKEAIAETGRQRLRPILMTAMTTILGMLTMAFGTGMGAEMMQPMAVVTIGGLLYATLMTLFVVPVLYDIFNGEKMKAREISLREEEMKGEKSAPAPEATPTPAPVPAPEAAPAPVPAPVPAPAPNGGKRVRLKVKKH